jgi:hypothetical protein
VIEQAGGEQESIWYIGQSMDQARDKIEEASKCIREVSKSGRKKKPAQILLND